MKRNLRKNETAMAGFLNSDSLVAPLVVVPVCTCRRLEHCDVSENLSYVSMIQDRLAGG